MTPSTYQRRIAIILTTALAVMLAALAGHLLYIQMESADVLAARAEKQQHMRIPIRPVRGNILDSRLRVLGGSCEIHSIFADPKVVRDPSAAATRVGRLLGMDPNEILSLLTHDPKSRFVWIKRRVSVETGEAIHRLNIPGIATVAEGTRFYPNAALAAHILGCVGIEEQGLDGLEKLFDDRLRGREGEAYVLADRSRRPIWTDADHFTPAEDGHHLVLTIDATIQGAAEQAVTEACAKYRAKSGSVVVVDPQTGAILAMANWPTYDPNRYNAYPVDSRRNRCITDTFPPGSSCKPFFACAALEAGVVHFGEVLFCENGFWAAAKMHDAGHSYGNLTFEEILVRSSNIGMAKLGTRLGNEREHECLAAFGFGHKTGVWLPGESAGVVFSLKRWTSLSTTRIPIGQEFAATPLQMAMAFSAIANRGKLLRPKILRGVLDNRGQVAVDLSEPEPVGQAIDVKTAREIINRALVGVVEDEHGTGKSCRIPGYKVFAKTGTAQKIDPETKTVSKTRYMSAFLAGAPAENPQVVVCVMINEPDKSIGYYGGTVAGPVAKKILEQALPYLGIPPSESVTEQDSARLVSHDTNIRTTD